MTAIAQPERESRGAWQALPLAVRVATLYAACLIVLAVAFLLLAAVLARLGPLMVAVAGALLLAALTEPLASLARRLGAPGWLAAVCVVLAVGLVVALPVILGWREMRERTHELGRTVDTVLAQVSDYLVSGPLQLDPQQVERLGRSLLDALPHTGADLLTGAATAFGALTTGLITMLLLFFLVKDGAAMWAWLVSLMPAHRRDRIDDAGRFGWQILGRYTRGILAVACVDAAGIGLALIIVDVPLVVPLILLTFIGGFIPYLGATLAGAAAVLVTLVSNNLADALVVLAAVVAVQLLESNLLEPVIVGRAVRLHPAAVLLAVAAGGLVAGIGGAVVAVPLFAVAYRVGVRLARPPTPEGGGP